MSVESIPQMEAIVLAGGRGTRLASVVKDLPKPMAPVQGSPFLKYLLDALATQGFERVVLSVGYMAEAIIEVIGNVHRGMEIVYCHEYTPLGTGGAIRASLAFTRTERVFVLNGDTYATVDCQAMLRQHESTNAAITMGLMKVPDTARYGAVRVSDGHVVGFREKGLAGPGYINCGVYLLGRTLFDGLEPPALPERFSFEEDVLQAHLARLRPGALLASGYFIDIGIPEDYARAQTEIPRLAG